MSRRDSDSLGDRMKGYEEPWRFVLPRRQPVIVRVDGRAFHTYLRDAQKPFDAAFSGQLGCVAMELCEQLGGAVFAYQQSDEISVLLQDWVNFNTQPFLGGIVQKLASVSASIATASLASMRQGTLPTFDARVFALPTRMEVANYFLWRQRDATRNSISMAGRAYFSARQLHGKSSSEIQEMLYQTYGVNWNDYPSAFKRGQVVRKHVVCEEVTYTQGEFIKPVTALAARSVWRVERARVFTTEPGSWLDEVIPPIDELSGPREDTAHA